MREKLRVRFGYPYAKQDEGAFKRQYVKWMYKPLLIVVAVVEFFISILILLCLFVPELLGPPEYMPVLIVIHFSLFIITFFVLCVAVLGRRQLLQHPNFYLALCDGYGITILIWSSLLVAYADYSSVIWTAFIYAALIVAIVTLFKPWQALILYMCDFAFLLVLDYLIWPQSVIPLDQISNAFLAVLISLVISVSFFRFRTRTFNDRMIIENQVAEISEINEKLQSLIHTDQLTGLLNRRYYDEVLPQRIEDICHSGQIVCALMADVDLFKEYNDRYGHQAGDLCLYRIANTIEEALFLDSVYIVRYGGEELFILAGAPDEEMAIKQAEDIRQAIEDANIEHLDLPQGIITISVGVAVHACTEGRPDLVLLTKEADRALYDAKAAGRNLVRKRTVKMKDQA